MNLKIIILLVIGCAWNVVSIKAQTFKNDELEISKLEDNLWVIQTADKTSMYLIEGKKKAMLIDTGTKCAKLDSIVGLITKKPLYVVITHAHPDHAGNIEFFEEIYLHQADTSLLTMFGKNYKGKVNYVKDGDVFNLGGKKIEVSYMPAHTPGSIVLLDRKSSNCFSGDAFGSGLVWLQLRPTAPIKTYINSCNQMQALMDAGINNIYCGHYPHLNTALHKEYISDMRTLAEALETGTAPEAKEYAIKASIGCENPMIVTLGKASIVFDPDHLK